jgi:copper(I)-binding protein
LLIITGVVTACGERNRPLVVRDGVAISAAFATASAAPDVSSLYFTIRNDGAGPDTLLHVLAPLGKAELHAVETVGGLSSMRRVERLPIPTGAKVRLEPGGYHVMLTQLPTPLRVGDSLQVSAVFSRADTLTFRVPVLTYTDVVERLDAEGGQAP